MTAVVVTGATGNVGRHVVRELTDRRVPVRAFVRDAARARALLGDDVELAIGDLGDPASIARALEGVERLFLACGNVPGQVEYETNAIAAAEATGVRRIVKLSAAAAAPDSPLLFPRWQGELEVRLRDSGIPAVVLRPTSYMTNLLMTAATVAETGKLFAPAAGAHVSYIHPRDVGAVAAVALTDDAHEGHAYVLSGPEAITYDRIAAELSAATGREIGFVNVPDEDALEALKADGVPEHVAEFVVQLFGAMRAGIAAEVTDTVQALTGREPAAFAEFAREHAAAFGARPTPAASSAR